MPCLRQRCNCSSSKERASAIFRICSLLGNTAFSPSSASQRRNVGLDTIFFLPSTIFSFLYVSTRQAACCSTSASIHCCGVLHNNSNVIYTSNPKKTDRSLMTAIFSAIFLVLLCELIHITIHMYFCWFFSSFRCFGPLRCRCYLRCLYHLWLFRPYRVLCCLWLIRPYRALCYLWLFRPYRLCGSW